jgi:hypothetical protein
VWLPGEGCRGSDDRKLQEVAASKEHVGVLRWAHLYTDRHCAVSGRGRGRGCTVAEWHASGAIAPVAFPCYRGVTFREGRGNGRRICASAGERASGGCECSASSV